MWIYSIMVIKIQSESYIIITPDPTGWNCMFVHDNITRGENGVMLFAK